VGDTKDVTINTRIIAATNRNLKADIEAGRFREDLYYRLNVVNIIVPPLRERKEDIPLLVSHFIGMHCDQDTALPKVSPEALSVLLNYGYPGNIRELENLIERALVLGGQAILPEHLPDEIRNPQLLSNHSGQNETDIVFLPLNLEELLSEIEKRYLLQALNESGGLKKGAAELLGLNFRSFRYRLKKYGLSDGTSDNPDDNS
jgi:two-component system response regulator PilR (NtrC family)